MVPIIVLAANYRSRTWFGQAYEVHYFFGMALTFAGRYVLTGDGSPFTAPWLISAVHTAGEPEYDDDAFSVASSMASSAGTKVSLYT